MIRPVQKDLYGIIGNPVKHSLSPAMMNAFFEGLGIPAVYVAMEADDIEDDLRLLGKMGFRGLSVTIPHKESVFRLADEVDATAQAIGAVNTLRRNGDRWEGFNTDWIGANRALEALIQLKGKNALVTGAGGAARAIVYGLMREGARVTVTNRSTDKGEALAKVFGCDFIPLVELHSRGEDHPFEIVVQCTPVGMSGATAGSIVQPSFFRSGMVVMDTVYKPLWTPFALAARERDCRVVSGLEVLLHQGVAQLQLWLGMDFPEQKGIKIMRQALEKAVKHE